MFITRGMKNPGICHVPGQSGEGCSGLRHGALHGWMMGFRLFCLVLTGVHPILRAPALQRYFHRLPLMQRASSAESTGFSLFAIAGTPRDAVPEAAITTLQATPEPAQPSAPAIIAKEPVAAGTTAAPQPPQAPAKSSPFPIVPVLAAICCTGLIGGGWYVRRWWIRRQNPALFGNYE